MTIRITPKTILRDIKQKFSAVYPYLKIEFSDKPHRNGDTIHGGHWHKETCSVLSISKNAAPGYITIRPWDKTGDIEKEFEMKFGLFPQIFRKEGEQWIQTAGTDILKLEEQNEIGKANRDNNSDNLWIEREKLL